MAIATRSAFLSGLLAPIGDSGDLALRRRVRRSWRKELPEMVTTSRGPNRALAVLLPVLSLALAATGALQGGDADVGALMNRLFHLVKREYAEIATMEARLDGIEDPGAQAASKARLAAKIAEFQERGGRIRGKLPSVRSAHPELEPTLGVYEVEMDRMDEGVRTLIERAGVAESVAKREAASAVPAGPSGDELQAAPGEPPPAGWDVPRGGAPRRVARPPMRAEPHWFAPPPVQATRPGAPRPWDLASQPRRTAPSRIEPGTGAPAVARREKIGDLVERIRAAHPEVHERTDSHPAPEAPLAAGPKVAIKVDDAAKRLRAAIEEKKPAGIELDSDAATVPIALEVRDEKDRPVSQRLVEFVLELGPGVEVDAALVDSSSRVEGRSLMELTDAAGVARIELRLSPGDEAVRVQRTVYPRGDRTVCHMVVNRS